MSNIINTSKLIKSNYEEELENNNNLDFKEYSKSKLLEYYNMYRYNNKISFHKIKIIINNFEKMNLHLNFKEPKLEEYFNIELNRLLITDFIISYIKIEDCSKNISNITYNEIFEIFLDLSYLYDFLNYLDIDISLINYIKYMLVLFLITLKRETIDKYFEHISWNLDEFFKYDVVYQMYSKFDDEFYRNNTIIKNIKAKHGNKELLDYDNNVDYLSDEYKFLDDLFVSYFHTIGGNIGVERQYTFKSNVNINDIDIHNFDFEDTYDYDDISNFIDIEIYKIEKNDPNYDKYFKLFLFRTYKKSLQYIQNIRTDFRCAKIQIKNCEYFHNLPESCAYKYEFITFVRELLPSYKIENEHILHKIFNIAYDNSDINIIQKIKEENPTFIPICRLKYNFNTQNINQYLANNYSKYNEEINPSNTFLIHMN